MYLVTDETTERAAACRDLAANLAPIFFGIVDQLQREERAGLDIKIAARYMADKTHTAENAPLPLMFACFCRGFIEGMIYSRQQTENPEELEALQQCAYLVDLAKSASEKELEQLRSMTHGKLGPEVETFIDTAIKLKKRGSL